MTKKETAKIIGIIMATYPNEKIPNIEATITAWHLILGDIDYPLAEKALASVISSREIPTFPAPGAIRRAAIDISCRIPSEDEILQEILNRLHNPYKQSPLSLLAKKVSDALGWEYLETSEEPGVLRGHIRHLYRACVERFKMDIVMTPIGNGEPLKELVSGNQVRVKKLTTSIGNPEKVAEVNDDEARSG